MGAFTFTVDNRGVATLVFDLVGEKVNKLSAAVMAELSTVLDTLGKDTSIRLLCLKSGKKSIFIAGADIAEIMGLGGVRDAEEKSRLGQDVMNRIEALPFPTIAAIDGACVGGGLELVLACAYRVASDNPKTSLGFPEVGLGIIPGWGGTQRAPRICGLVNALTLITSGRSVDGRKALGMHLVDALYPKAFFEDGLRGFEDEILRGRHARERVLARRTRRKAGTRFLEGTFIGRSLVYRKARAAIEKAGHGHYPAPVAALTVIRRTRRGGLERGLRIERDAFASLACTDVSKNLIRVYTAGEDLKKAAQGALPPRAIESAAVLGAGVMGGAIAWLMSDRDIPVTMVDLEWDYIRRGFQSARGIYGELLRAGKTDERLLNLRMHKISGSTDYGHLSGKGLVVEAIVERLDIKRTALARAEAAVGEDAVLASNTSSLSISAMASALKRPDRFGGLHFFNPVNRMPLVEVVAGEKTSADTVATLVAFAKALRKTPVVVKDSPGFLVNRVLMSYLNEAALMVEEGMNFDAIDRAVFGFGMPMGPFTLLDEIGIDIASEVGKSLSGAFESRVKPSSLFELMRESKLLGKKTRAGFYLHGKGKRTVNPTARSLIASRYRAPSGKGVSSDQIIRRCIYPMINEASLCLQEGIIERPDFLDMALILGIGFPPFRGGLLRFADSQGVSAIVDSLKGLEQKLGGRFAPSALLREKVGRGFYG